ncbi:hypothetical protein HKD37_08G023037 [Glycine soja]
MEAFKRLELNQRAREQARWEKLRDEVKKVKDHMGRDWLCQVQHSFCEGNACVDDLTRMGVTIGGGWALLTEPPLEIMTHLLADSH